MNSSITGFFEGMRDAGEEFSGREKDKSASTNPILDFVERMRGVSERVLASREHPCPEVQRAIADLDAALCEWERNAGLQSALVIREQGGFCHRSVAGKPFVRNDVSDERLFAVLGLDAIEEGEAERR